MSKMMPRVPSSLCFVFVAAVLAAPATSHAEWQPDDVLSRIDPSLQEAISSDISAGPINDNEQAALASAIQFIAPELWYSSGIKVPLRKVDGSGLCGAEPARSTASLYLVEYISRTYGMLVIDDIPGVMYSAWVESPTASPLTGRQQIPLFYYSDGPNADAITRITPSRDLAAGPMAGLGDDGTGGTEADNGFSTNNSGRGYWPMYLRGYLTNGGMIPYNTIPFGRSVRRILSEEEQSTIPPQTYNYLYSPSEAVIKIACHADGVLHGWVPGEPDQFEVRFELPATTIANAVPVQARKMRRDNELGRRTGIMWPTRGTSPAAPEEFPLTCQPE